MRENINGPGVLALLADEGETERDVAREALRRSGGNVCEAARSVGILHHVFREHLHRLGVDPEEFREAARHAFDD